MRRRKPEGMTAEEWEDWVDGNRRLLHASGLPNYIFETRKVWLEFLDHGYAADPRTSTCSGLSGLTPLQMASLLRVLSITPEYLNSVAGRKAVIWAAEQIEAAHHEHS
jgi:hypothetical protein